ncbi:MAG: hydrolase [Bacillota bacterium]|nr:hydrolase [Bacillota bacterium]
MNDYKKTYYVNMVNGEVLPEPAGMETHFRVSGTDKEIKHLMMAFSEKYNADQETFGRSHEPFKEYHKDNENDLYDATMVSIYQQIYKLGDAEARAHIKAMGILDGSAMESPKGF